MQLTIDGQPIVFMPVQTFRTLWGLPDDFSVARFEPKDWTGLGSLERTAQTLPHLKQRLVAAVPDRLNLVDLSEQIDHLTAIFRDQLEAINSQVGLHEAELDFAVAGFQDVLLAVGYHLIQLAYSCGHNPDQIRCKFDFATIYRNWLTDSVRASATVHAYRHTDQEFKVQMVYYAYGRLGLAVQLPTGEVCYTADTTLACPASGFMKELCEQVARTLSEAFTKGAPKIK